MNKELSDKARELKRNYHREWQRKNKDKVREYNLRYWERKAEELTECERLTKCEQG